MEDFVASLSHGGLALLFLSIAACIGYFGVQITHIARHLAYISGMGEALTGAIFIGASTSLSGIVTSTTAASQGAAELAISNCLGGIAAQTVFLAFADIVYRKANLEHAAASVENLMMSALLITLLTLPLVALALPDIAIGGIHPITPILVVSYLFGLRVLAKTHAVPMWLPKQTAQTTIESRIAPSLQKRKPWQIWGQFFALVAIVGVCGWALAQTALEVAARSGMAEGLVGGLFTAVSTSLPELIVAITAVRLGALNLAVGDIIGGNTFDTLFLAISDLFYTEGSIYARMTVVEEYWLAISLLMSGVLLMGLIFRQRFGVAKIGLESLLLLIIYFVSLGIVSIL